MGDQRCPLCGATLGDGHACSTIPAEQEPISLAYMSITADGSLAVVAPDGKGWVVSASAQPGGGLRVRRRG